MENDLNVFVIGSRPHFWETEDFKLKTNLTFKKTEDDIKNTKYNILIWESMPNFRALRQKLIVSSFKTLDFPCNLDKCFKTSQMVKQSKGTIL